MGAGLRDLRLRIAECMDTGLSGSEPGTVFYGCGMTAHRTRTLVREGAVIVVPGEGDDPHVPEPYKVVRGSPGPICRALRDRIRPGLWSAISGIGYAGQLEDGTVVLLGDLAHGLAEVAAPHRLVRYEREILDQRLELKRLSKDRHRPDLHAVGEDPVAHMRRGDEEVGVVLVGLGDDFVGAGYGGGEDGVALQLPPDVHEDGVAGLHPLHEGSVSTGHSPDLLLIEDLLVDAVGGGDPVGHGKRFRHLYEKPFEVGG